MVLIDDLYDQLVTLAISEASLSFVPIVRDFIDVFPNELPGLPPVRQLIYRLRLLLGQLHCPKHHIVWHRLS